MRYHCLLLSVLLLSAGALQSAEHEPTIIEKGPHHQIWERLVERQFPNGQIRYESHSFTEFETGLHYLSNGQWENTKEEIELFQDGAIARQGPHQVIFAPNIATPGAIDMQSSDGLRFRSHVLGLSFLDMANGNSVMFAEVRDTLGELHAPNQIIYPNCFTDDVKADIRFTYTKAGLEQDIILRDDLPVTPEDFGLNSATTVIEILTEFIDAPNPSKYVLEVDGLADENLDFGEMRMGPGRAFTLETRTGNQWSIPMVKEWTLMEGRRFLLERMPYAAARQELDALARANSQAGIRSIRRKTARMAGTQRLFPATPHGKRSLSKIQLSTVPQSKMGLVMDYSLLAAATNTYRFECDKTYYISGAVYVTNAIFEGGAVIKYTNSAKIDIALPGSMTWEVEAFRTVNFTARDDHTVGEQIGSGSISGFYANPALSLHSASHVATNARISYAQSAISMDAGTLYLRDSQFIRCSNVFANASSVMAENVLIYGVTNVISGSSSFAGTHTTANQVSSGFSAAAATGTIKLTNSLVAAMTSWGGATVTSNTLYRSTHSGIFQTVGAASHYLTNSSPYRNLGITNISSSLLAALARKTTYPPLILSNGVYTNGLTLVAQAQRDTDLPDIGYHYDPLDYAIGGIQVTNCEVTVMPGTAIGTYTGSGAAYSLSIGNGATFNCQGTATSLNRIVRYNTVQEQANTNWSGGFNPSFMIDDTGTVPSIQVRFTEWACPARDIVHVKGYFTGASGSTAASFQDNLFRGGSFMNELAYIAVTNCLFERVYSEQTGLYTNTAIFRNNTFVGGSNYLWLTADVLHFRDNLFDRSGIQQDERVVSGWNAYTTNNTRLTNTIATTDVFLTNAIIAYLTGPLGRFYLPTNTTPSLVNRGSTNANLLGLYHFTISTNQVKEANTTNDIGFHHVATTNGVPVDTDSDGAPDYLEDANGNGVVNSGETDPESPTDLGLRVLITRPKNGANIP